MKKKARIYTELLPVKLDKALKIRLEQEARRSHQSKSDITRKALRAYLS